VTVRFIDQEASSESYKSDHEDDSTFSSGSVTTTNSAKGGEYGESKVSEIMLAAATVSVSYARDFSDPVVGKHSFAPPAVTIDLCPYTSDYIVPGSVQFTWMGHVYADYGGALIRDRTPTDTGFLAGQIDYGSGIATVFDYVVGGLATAFTLDSCWTIRQNWTTASIFMRTQASPIKPSGFVMNLSDTHGDEIVATGDINGDITGTHLKGRIDYESGVVELQFGDYLIDTALTDEQKAEWWYSVEAVGTVLAGKIWRPWPVDPTTLRYNSVTFSYLPLDAELIGIDPVRLPPDGRVPIFRKGGFAVIGNMQAETLTATNGMVVNCNRVRLSRVRVVGNDGLVISAGYTADLEAGTVTFTNVNGYAQPVRVENRIEDMVQVSDVQIGGRLTFTRQLTHAYPVGSYVSSALVSADLKARVSIFFDQATWDALTWSDTLVGNAATATYNAVLAPVVVTNAGAVTERWAMRFTSTTNFDVIGEHVGVIGQGSINTATTPINPATGSPYFTIPALGWGIGWSVGNVLRFDTVGAMFPVWVVRTIQQGAESVQDDSFTLLVRGDVDRA